MKLPCPPDQWPRFSARLDQLLALPEAERAGWLAALPEADADLRDGLAAVLDGLPGAGGAFLDGPPTLPPVTAPSGAAPGDVVGPYTLVRELGRGGMGIVWLARRSDGAFARDVALKLPHAHLLAGSLRERFDRERDILAALDHTHIARFYDAGLAADGQPYLALEAVDGRPITDWCREQALPLAARLDLFAQMADAVSHAHGQFIAHRDLKPANVLVTAGGQVKLLDFGIAKLLAGEDGTPADSTALTRAQGLLATPRYAAPEQLAGGPVSVATDVYALGLMLFELLTDAPPPPPGEPVPPPSHTTTQASRRKALRGDLDAIVDRALQPRPTDRYQSVAALAEDLARHRRTQPIHARRITGWVRLARFARRHRVGVALSGLLAMSLVAGVAGVVWQGQRAKAEARRAEAVKGFVLGIFNAVDPRRPSDQPRGQITARQLMDLASERIDRDFEHDPALRIELLGVVANVYGYLAEDDRYEVLHRRQMALAEKYLGVTDPVYIQGLLVDAYGDIYNLHPDAAKATLARVDDLIHRAGLDASEQRAAWWMAQSEVLRGVPGAHAQRIQALERAIALYRRHAPQSEDYPAALANLANVHNAREAWPQAQALYEEALAIPLAPGASEENLSVINTNLAMSLMEQGQVAAALKHFETATAQALSTYGPNHNNHFHAVGNHARWLHRLGERRRALAMFESLPTPSGGGGPGDDTAREYRGAALLMDGRPDLALPILRGVQKDYAAHVNHEADQRRLDGLLGTALAQTGDAAAARHHLWAALQASEAHDAPDSAALAAARERWARFLLDQGDPQALDQGLALLRQAAQPGPAAEPRRAIAAQMLAQLGLARVALLRHDLPAAAQAVAQAQTAWSSLPASREVRLQSYLWAVQGELWRHQGRTADAQALQAQAAASSAGWYAPEALPPKRACTVFSLRKICDTQSPA
ncbi:serine/threonine-protein kinase [Pelomonas cellulosilytica]|uniref:Serine/threonine-protein kinase n=1 Tax=Pelomonas cellulosilytica TaxID=2906762 RepID=A0ABS8XYC3_9BURK|nr:serine/threonine-protein kinase [Pelomonas sp. P8]MCE4555718.1 serine/threonine-protein kinase [Pelomonas sp. P8]